MIQLNWKLCTNNEYCRLRDVYLHQVPEAIEGVYIVWYWDNDSNPIFLEAGQGYIRNRIADERHKYKNARQTLYVTWAQLASTYHNGVEAFLGYELGLDNVKNFPQANHIEVNLPGWF